MIILVALVISITVLIVGFKLADKDWKEEIELPKIDKAEEIEPICPTVCTPPPPVEYVEEDAPTLDL